MLSSSKFSLLKGHFVFGGAGGFATSPKKPKFGPNSYLTNNFLHYKFQLSMLSS